MFTQAMRITERQNRQDREESNGRNSGDADNRQVRSEEAAAGLDQLKGRHIANSLFEVVSD